MKHVRDPGPEGCPACNADTERQEAKRVTLFERMAEIARQNAVERARIRSAQPGDTLPPAARKLDVRPAFTGAGAPSFKPARKGKKL